ncbi:hypothetical protein Tco_1447399 [Tanacetum coccineum]
MMSKLVKKVKKLEAILKRRHVVLTDSEDEEPEDQGRIIQDIDDDPLGSKGDFVTPTKPSGDSQEEEISPTTLEAAKILSKVASQKSKSVDKGKRYKMRKESKGTDASVKRYGKTYNEIFPKKQMIDDKDEEKVTEVKEEKPVIRTGKRKKQKARKGINVDKSPQGDSKTDEEESVEAMTPTPLDTKSNIMENWKIFQQGERNIYQIIRANRADTVYMSFGDILKDFTREVLIELYMLVMQKYGTNRPEDAYDRVL